MSNLLITVLAIALVAVVALIGVYYGGEAFGGGSVNAQANRLVTQAEQIIGGWNLYVTQNAGSYNGTTVSGLATNGKFISTVPKPPPAAGANDWTLVKLADDTTVTGLNGLRLNLGTDDIANKVCLRIAQMAGGASATPKKLASGSDTDRTPTAGRRFDCLFWGSGSVPVAGDAKYLVYNIATSVAGGGGSGSYTDPGNPGGWTCSGSWSQIGGVWQRQCTNGSDPYSPCMYNESNSQVSCSGPGPSAASLAASPTSLTFTTNTNTASATQVVTITNNGGTGATSVSVTLSSGSSYFDLNTNCGATLAASASCTATLNAKSTASAGTYNGNLAVAYSGGTTINVPLDVTVSASGGGYTCPADMDAAYNEPCIGVTNHGDYAVCNGIFPNVMEFSCNGGADTCYYQDYGGVGPLLCKAGGTAPPRTCDPYISSSTCPYTGQFSNYTGCGGNDNVIQFSCGNAGTCNYLDDGGSYPLLCQEVGPPGSGTGGGGGSPSLSRSPSSLTFTASANAASGTQVVTVTNGGTASASSVAITFTTGTNFTKSTTCGSSIAASASCTVTVNSNSISSAGTYNDTLNIAYSGGTTLTVPLTATITAASACPSGMGQAMGPSACSMMGGGSQNACGGTIMGYKVNCGGTICYYFQNNGSLACEDGQNIGSITCPAAIGGGASTCPSLGAVTGFTGCGGSYDVYRFSCGALGTCNYVNADPYPLLCQQ